MRMRLLFFRLPMWHLWNANDKVASAKKNKQDVKLSFYKMHGMQKVKKKKKLFQNPCFDNAFLSPNSPLIN